MRERIFVSSVQKEFASERRKIKKMVTDNPLLSRHFEVQLYEDWPGAPIGGLAGSLEALDSCQTYLLIVGRQYGTVTGGLSITHHEYHHAKGKKMPRLVFIQGDRTTPREEGTKLLLGEVYTDPSKYKQFDAPADLMIEIHASLMDRMNEGCAAGVSIRVLLAASASLLLLLLIALFTIAPKVRFARLQEVQRQTQAIEEKLNARYPDVAPRDHGNQIYVDDSNVILGQDIWRNGHLDQRTLFWKGRLRARDTFGYANDKVTGKRRDYFDDANRLFLTDVFAADGLLATKTSCPGGTPPCVSYFDLMRSPVPAVTQLYFYR